MTEKIGQQAYRLSLPTDWKIHPVFHISLLKDWKTADLQEDQPAPTDDVPDVENHTTTLRGFYGGVRSSVAEKF